MLTIILEDEKSCSFPKTSYTWVISLIFDLLVYCVTKSLNNFSSVGMSRLPLYVFLTKLIKLSEQNSGNTYD